MGELNFFEKSIAALSPKTAVKRAASRTALDYLTKERRYEAGRPNRATAGWHPRLNTSGNSEIEFDLQWLRGRARELVENNPYAKKAVSVITTNVVGTGIRPSVPKGLVSKIAEKKITNAWRMWAETKRCDYNGQLNIYGIMMQAWRASVESGDAFIRVIRDAKERVPIKLQLLEADYCDDTRHGQILDNGNYIMLGVEFDGNTHKRVAYWMFEKHPNDMVPIKGNLLSVRVPADQIIHVYEILRPGQVRGIPHGVAAFVRLKNLDEFEDAQLVRQKIAACYSVFVKKNDPDFLEYYPKQDDDEIQPLGEKLSPGIIDYLAPGESVEFANPPGTNGYEPYTRSGIRGIAAAYLVTYESISNDLSGVNFSSGRMGWLESHRQFQQWQDFILIPQFCQEVEEKFLFAAGLTGINTENVYFEWTPPRREMIDPVKETHGMEMQIRMGIASRSDIIRQMGGDPEKVSDEIFAEQKEQDAAGAMFYSDPKWDATRVNFGKEAYLQVKSAKAAGDGKPQTKSAK